MKNSIKLSIIALALVLLSACENRSICIKGNGVKETRELNLADFTGVELDGSFDVVILQGNRYKIEAIGDENIIDDVQAQEIGGICKLDLDNGCYKDYNLRIEVTMPELKDVYLDGSGDITIEDFDDMENLNVEISGSGNITAYDLDQLTQINCRIDGSGDIRFNRIVTGIKGVSSIINGSGNIRAFELQAEDVTTRISGSGSSEVYANKTLSATIEGSGNILYKGQPSIQQSVSGSGNLINAN